MSALFVHGVGVCTPRFPDVLAWRRSSAAGEFGEVDEAARPTASILPAGQRRRCSQLTRAMCEAAGQALTGAGCEPSELATVFASAYGETTTMLELLAQIYDDGVLSPIRFGGSVHNTASGQLSIATRNRGFTTSVAAGGETPAMALFEAQGLLAAGHEQVLVVLGDAAAPAPLVGEAGSFGVAAMALLLAARPAAGGLGSLHDLHIDDPRCDRGAPTATWDAPPELAAHPCRGAFALLDALLSNARTPAVLGLAAQGGAPWTISFEPPPGAYPPVSELLPHGPPMVLVDGIVDHGDDFICCEVEVRDGAPFVKDGAVSSVVTLEYMAQTVGAYTGYRAHCAGERPQLGFLIGSRELRLERPSLAVGTALRISAKRVFGDAQIGQFACRVETRDEGELIAEGSLSVALDKDGILST